MRGEFQAGPRIGEWCRVMVRAFYQEGGPNERVYCRSWPPRRQFGGSRRFTVSAFSC